MSRSDQNAEPAAQLDRQAIGHEQYNAAYDAVLAQWPLPYEELYLRTRFGITHVIASGPREASPLLLLPAMMTTATMWRPNIARLGEHYRTYAIDTIGEPNKSEPTRGLRSRRDCTDWLVDVLDALHVQRASLVGLSFGGYLALNQVMTTPERIDRAVLVSPATFPLTWKFYYYGSLSALRISNRIETWIGNGVPFDPADAAWARLYAMGPRHGKFMNRLSIGALTEPEMRAIRTPLLLLIGDKEVIYDRPPDAVLAHARELIPGLRTQIVPGANHVASMSTPELFNERILAFLQSAP